MVAGSRLFARADDTVSVWSAREDLTAGSTIGAGDLVGREVRFSSPEDADHYLASSTAVSATTLQRAVGAGELLPRAALGRADPGPVIEVPLSVAADAVPQTVQAGSVVDVWVTPDPATSPRSAVSVRVFESVRVVAAPMSASTIAPTGNRQIIVGLDVSQESSLAAALAQAARGTTVITRRG